MAEYSRVAKGHFTSTGSAQVINLPFQPDAVQFWNYTAANTAATSQNIISAYWDASMGQGFAVIEGYNATPALIYDVVSTNGINTFSAGTLLQYGALQGHNQGAITDFSITAASPAVVTTIGNHGLQSGNVIVFENLFQSSTTGMQQMAGVPLTVTVTSATQFSVNWNASGSNYMAFNTATATNNVGTYKQVLYPYLYAPNQAVITAINTSTSVVTTAAAHNFVVGQEVAFRIPPAWGSFQLNSLPDNTIPGSPIYWYVTAVTQNTFTLGLNNFGQTLAAANITAFTSNVSFAGARTLPQVISAGDVNTGGVQYSGSALYPAPLVYSGAGTGQVSTINGPAIQGSFINNTSQGFIIGAGAGRVLTTGVLVGANTNVIYWRAYQSDLAVN